MRYLRLFLALTFACLASAVAAQGQFSPAITVNDRAITAYEIEQRIRLLEAFRSPGNLQELAREQLIEDKLKEEALARAGLRITDDGLARALDEFSARANLTTEQFVTVLGQNGIDRSTLEEYVRIGVSWRDYIRSRFGPQSEITEAEIDRAIGSVGASYARIEVLLSEIIIPAPPPQAAQALATAERISQTRSTATFSAEARRVSALPSRTNGGRLGWLPIANYPAAIRELILGLDVGEVTPPLPIPNGVALFQMRGVREIPTGEPTPTAIEYAAFYLPATGADQGRTAAMRLAARLDTCDDLYGAALGQPEDVLERDTLPLDQIPTDVALELARLDPGETSTNLTRADGQTRVLLMLCNRQFSEGEAPNRDAVRNQLRSQRLTGLANALLEDLRASATITGN